MDIETSADVLKMDFETSADALKMDIETSADALKTDMHELKSDMSILKSDLAANAEKLELKMTNKIKNCHDNVIKCIKESEVRVNEIEKLTKGVPALVDTVQSKLSEGSEEIKSIGCRVAQNRKGIDELEISIKRCKMVAMDHR